MTSFKFEHEGVEINCIVYDEPDLKDDSKLRFIVRDVVGLAVGKGIPITKLSVIESIRVVDQDKRNRGNGSAVLKWMINYLKDCGYGDIILLQAAPLIADYPIEPKGNDLYKILAKQATFFEYNGFRNINALCNFNSSIPYLYMDEKSRPIFREIFKIENKVE